MAGFRKDGHIYKSFVLDSKQSTPVSAADPLLGGHGNCHGEQLGERLELATPVQCGYTANVDNMEHNNQGDIYTHAMVLYHGCLAYYIC